MLWWRYGSRSCGGMQVIVVDVQVLHKPTWVGEKEVYQSTSSIFPCYLPRTFPLRSHTYPTPLSYSLLSFLLSQAISRRPKSPKPTLPALLPKSPQLPQTSIYSPNPLKRATTFATSPSTPSSLQPRHAICPQVHQALLLLFSQLQQRQGPYSRRDWAGTGGGVVSVMLFFIGRGL